MPGGPNLLRGEMEHADEAREEVYALEEKRTGSQKY